MRVASVNVQFLGGMYTEDTDCADTGMSEEVKHGACVIGKVPWRKKCQPTPVLFPGKSQGWRCWNTKYSLEGLLLKLKLQNFSYLMQRADSLEKTLMLGKAEDRRRRG